MFSFGPSFRSIVASEDSEPESKSGLGDFLGVLLFGREKQKGQSTIGLIEDLLLGKSSDDPDSFLGSGSGLGGLGALGLASFLKDRGYLDPKMPATGYQGEIPEYQYVRQQVTGRDDSDRRPGSGGRRYFSSGIYAKAPENREPMTVEAARAAAQREVMGLGGIAPTPRPEPLAVMASGGAVLQDGGYLEGDTDGQADLVPADIEEVQEARLSHGEYVLPADVVAILGNGNSNAGAEVLDRFMSEVRRKATGTPKQQKNIDPDKMLSTVMKNME